MRTVCEKLINPTNRNFSNRNGFTLIEILISIAFISIGLAALATLSAGVTRGSQHSKNITSAVTLMQDKMEEFKNTDYSSIASGSQTNITAEGNAGGDFSRSWSVTTSGTAKQITVTVTWPFNGVTKSRSLTTFISQ